jgi:hypothetical protein
MSRLAWRSRLPRSNIRLGPAFLVYLHIIICCLSLIYVSKFYAHLEVVMFDSRHLYGASLNIALVALASVLFTFARFSFGYVLGFYFYTIIAGYLWLIAFSRFNYDHALAATSALGSAIAFLVPALFITSPVRQRYTLSPPTLENVLSFILIFAVGVISIGAFYNFKLVGIGDIYKFRNGLQFPIWLAYAIGVTCGSLLPFAFACFVEGGHRWRAALALVLLLLFYPITLAKLLLFAPVWLLFLALLSSFLEARTSAVLSLLLPLSAGVVLALLFQIGALPYDLVISYFGPINFRMVAIPSSALDFYNDYFATHEITHFCQISFLKPFADCPYTEPLSIVLEKAYHLGNFNASLFATEGIASVGLIAAPISALFCGLVIALANCASSGLPSRFVLLSGGILPQVFLNVPLTTSLVTNGALMLFFLWYVIPRAIFETDQSSIRRPTVTRTEE